LSTVPPDAAPAPAMYLDLPYAVALRDICNRYKMRAQQNTKYVCSSVREATVTHIMNMVISKLTSADIQSTITPDEGRNVPWHIYNMEAIDNAKQAYVYLDGFNELVELKKEGPLVEMVRDLKERATLFMMEIVEAGGYFNAVEQGFFVDSAKYPARNGDGIARKIKGVDNVCFVTDALRPAGEDVTESYIGEIIPENRVIIEDGVAKLPDRSSFAGSIATSQTMLKTGVNYFGFTLEDTVTMLTKTPARILGYTDIGVIEKGKAEIFNITDNTLVVEMGKTVSIKILDLINIAILKVYNKTSFDILEISYGGKTNKSILASGKNWSEVFIENKEDDLAIKIFQ